MALSFVAVHFSCVLAQPLTYDPPLRGLDLVEDKTADIIESMRAAMVRKEDLGITKSMQ